MVILNIAAGKFDPILPDKIYQLPYYILNVDTSYFASDMSAAMVENDIIQWGEDPNRVLTKRHLDMDVFQFMEQTKIKFDRIVIYRFLEHVSFTQVPYFIYLVSTILKKKGLVDVIVPDYQILTEKIIYEESYFQNPEFDFEAHNIELTTELLNEPSCPHASIWTTMRMVKMWTLEKRFMMKKNITTFEFDGRNIYLRSLIERV